MGMLPHPEATTVPVTVDIVEQMQKVVTYVERFSEAPSILNIQNFKMVLQLIHCSSLLSSKEAENRHISDSVILEYQCGAHPGMTAPGTCPEDPVQRCDTGEIQPPCLSGSLK
ncbi:uncharacterized protein LOC143673847 isoform X1 [Tamandua tetradactyla]|uniref:uncharacterized protein LOC143673847 isoform X1 n=1 Tax=Tamandua tetradactyla TaxID=48850 RepID=UPI0040549D7C